jgi:methyl-accepting chemotaxis protein
LLGKNFCVQQYLLANPKELVQNIRSPLRSRRMNAIEEVPEMLDSRLLLSALVALRRGDFSVRLPTDLTGVNGKIADTLNDIIDNSDKIAQEIVSVSRLVGHEGRLNQRAASPMVAGGWATILNSVNALIDDLVRPTTEMARVIGAVAKGDLSQNMAVEVDGRPLRGQFLGGDAGGARGRHRGQAGRPGQRARRGRYLEGFDGFGQLDGG